MLVQEKHRYRRKSSENCRQAKMEQDDLFFSTKRKKAIKMLLRCQKQFHITLWMYAHKHGLTHTQTQPHAPSNSDKRTEKDCDFFFPFFTAAFRECPSFVFTVGNTAKRNICFSNRAIKQTLREPLKKYIYIYHFQKEEVKPKSHSPESPISPALRLLSFHKSIVFSRKRVA